MFPIAALQMIDYDNYGWYRVLIWNKLHNTLRQKGYKGDLLNFSFLFHGFWPQTCDTPSSPPTPHPCALGLQVYDITLGTEQLLYPIISLKYTWTYISECTYTLYLYNIRNWWMLLQNRGKRRVFIWCFFPFDFLKMWTCVLSKEIEN